MSNLNGKVAVVTGGNSGIGRASAKAFADAGAKVAIFGRNQETLDAAAADLPDGSLSIQGDVTDHEALTKLFAEVESKLGKVDVVFVNAGVAKVAPLDQMTPKVFDSVFDINVKGAYFTVQSALPHLNDGASILFNASVAGNKGMPGFSVYSATKAAVRSLARSFTAELAPRNIRVNSISPGPIETPIYDRMDLPAEAAAEFGEQIVSMVPLGRWGQSEEVAKLATFLASDDASYITGIDAVVDGGMTQV